MKCVFILFIVLVQQVISQNVTEEILFESNNTTTEENFELTTTEEKLELTTTEEKLELTTTEEKLELTTPFFLDSNITNDTIDIPIPEITVSPPVSRILSEIFRTYKPYCSRHSYGRGIGRPLQTCPEHASEQDGLLCYPPCRHGYNGVGPVCWEKCENITSFGFICLDIRLSKRHSCPWYDACGLVRRSCVSCTDNYTNIGCLCGRFNIRSSYGRGVGSSLICSKSYEQDGGLCYKKCDKNYNGIGPVCWQNCPSSHPYSCFSGCSKTKEICKYQVKDMIKSVIISSLKILNILIGIPFISSKTVEIIANAAIGQWVLVAKDIAIIAGQLAKRMLPELALKFLDWSFGTLESATNNATLILTATALTDNKILLPILNFFHFDSIYLAFNHGKCELIDNNLDFI